MANWNLAWVVYCDGGSFSGDAERPVNVTGPNGTGTRALHFKGRRNLAVIIDELKARGMSADQNASMAVLGGCSAGGLGALVQCDYFADQLPGVKSRCVGDAGVFLDAVSLTTWPGRTAVRAVASASAAAAAAAAAAAVAGSARDTSRRGVMAMQFGNVMKMQNLSLPWRCLASAANTFPGACFFPQHVLASAATPRFIRNSFYNYGEFEMLPVHWQNAHAWPSTWGTYSSPTCRWESDNRATDGCTPAQHAVKQSFQQQFVSAMAPAIANTSAHGVFLDACSGCHCKGLFSGIAIDGVTFSQALSGWLFNDTRVKQVATPAG